SGWTKHLRTLSRRSGRLTKLGLSRLELRGPGTELDVGLVEGTRVINDGGEEGTDQEGCGTDRSDRVRREGHRDRRPHAGPGLHGREVSLPREAPGSRSDARGHRRLDEDAEHSRRGTTMSPVHPKVRTVRETHPSIERARATLSRPASGPPDRGDGVSAPRE